MHVEQAVFTSAKTDRAEGYHLAAASSGLTDVDRRELAAWGPSHDALSPRDGEPVSVNFYPLPSGAFCVSKTVVAGREYSGRGQRVYTHALVVPPEVLARFANNPFALLRAAWAKGLLQAHDDIPPVLLPANLLGRAVIVDEGLVAQLTAELGPRQLGRLFDAVLTDGPIALAGIDNPDRVLAGLFNCLPVECRRELSFSTGLKLSPRRPFHLIVVPQVDRELRSLNRQAHVSLIDLNQPDDGRTLGGWGCYIAEILADDNLALLAAQLNQRHPNLHLGTLNSFGDELLRQWHAAQRGTELQLLQRVPDALTGNNRAESRLRHRTSAPHTVSAPFVATATITEPALASSHPGNLDLLARLDELVTTAVGGDAQALDELSRLWPRTAKQLSPEVAEQWRVNYLRHALSTWDAWVGQQQRNPEQAVAALDVLCLLFDE